MRFIRRGRFTRRIYRNDTPSSIRTVPSAPEFHRILQPIIGRSRALPPIGNGRGTHAPAFTLPRRRRRYPLRRSICAYYNLFPEVEARADPGHFPFIMIEARLPTIRHFIAVVEEPLRQAVRLDSMSWNSYTPPRRPSAPVPALPYSSVVRVYRTRRADRGGRLLTTLGALAILGCFAIFLLVGASTAAFYIYFQQTDRVYPGVKVGAASLGGMTLEEAYAAVQAANLAGEPILVTNGYQYATVSPSDLGIQVDAIQIVLAAHAVGRSGLIVDDLSQIASNLWSDRSIPPRFIYNPAAAAATLESLRPALSLPAVDAALRIEAGRLVTTLSQAGYALDVQQTLAALSADPEAVRMSHTLMVAVQPVAPRIADVGPALAEAERLLNSPAVISAYDPIADETIRRQIERPVLAEWLVVEQSPDGPHVKMDATKVRAYLEGLTTDLGPHRYLEIAAEADPAARIAQGKPVDARVRYRPSTYTVQSGDTLLKIGWKLGIPFWRIAEANPGLDADRLLAGMVITIPAKDELLPLPVVPEKRIVISISAQRLWAYHQGSVLREFVISTGMDRSPTQPGVFQVQTHDPNAYASIWDLWMPNWLGIYEAWPGFMNGIHGLPLLSSGRRLWAGSLGTPASYGCIILDLPAAEWLYQWTENGVVVEIKE